MKKILAIALLAGLAASTGLAQTQTTPIKPTVKTDALKDAKDSQSEMSEEQQMQLQMQQDRKKKMQQNLSNQLKKNSDTDSSIIQNMK